MQEHQLSSSGERTVDSKLFLDEEGKVEDEKITNVGTPSAFDEEYHCTCGEDFDTFKQAQEHILDNR